MTRNRQAIIAVGDAFAGIEIYGPVPSALEAEEWAASNFPDETTLQSVELIAPDEEPD